VLCEAFAGARAEWPRRNFSQNLRKVVAVRRGPSLLSTLLRIIDGTSEANNLIIIKDERVNTQFALSHVCWALATPIPFSCPSCEAEYKIVTIEATNKQTNLCCALFV
jgi:hypothetical protein